MNKPLVIYHANCADGFGAAFAAWLKLKDDAEYLPMSYNEAEYNPQDRCLVKDDTCYYIQDREIYILDFSFGRQLIDELFSHAKRVVWLDHHKTAFEMWCGGIPDRSWFHSSPDNEATMFNDGPSTAYITLDNNKSGALLAWEYFHPNTEVPMLIRHIDDRDRWQFKLEGSKELHAALGSMKPWSFEQWRTEVWSPYTGAEGYFEEELQRLYENGAAILRAQDAHVKSTAKHARKCEIWKLKDDPYGMNYAFKLPGLAVNSPLHQSELGHELANQSCTFGLIWYLAEDNKVRCSLRSNGDYDVSAIAKAFGGGGHRNAAGFETDIDTLMGWMK